MSEHTPKVVLFGSLDDPRQHGLSWLELSVTVIKEVGWQTLPFDDQEYALKELDESISALVTRVRGTDKDKSEDTSSLIERSNQLQIPRAVITVKDGESSGTKFVRKDINDIYSRSPS